MNRIVLIIPYFGIFNNYFEFWLKSAENNLDIDFLIITDNKKPVYIADNIKWIESDFSLLVKKVKNIIPELNNNIVLNSPYKLCDYKLLYGKLFVDYILPYEFWGFCDMDLLFGDFSKFISDEILNSYDKFYYRGHLTIFRNNSFFRNLYLTNDSRMILTFKEAWKTKHCCHFDELDAWNSIIEESGYKCYKKIDFADVNIKSKRFKLAMGEKNVEAKQIYVKNKKKLFCYYLLDGKVEKEEILYVHLQKRTINIETRNKNSFLIVPNKLVNDQEITKELIEENSLETKYWKEYYFRRVKEIIKNVRNGALKVRIQVIMRKVKKYGS